MNHLCVIGFPSKVGGADTELDHQIHCWQALGLQVHLIHTAPLDANLQAMRMEDRGCVIHEPRDWRACRGMHAISYCNGEFLKHLPEIKEHARSTTFVNCMTWLFDAELAAHRQGLIDQFVYQTDHALAKVKDRLIEANPRFRPFKVRPYFHAADFPFIGERPRDRFRFGRVSREDADKFHQAQLWVYETMTAPVLKEGIILGINDRIRQKVGTEPNWIKGYAAGAIPARQVYAHSDCIIQMSDTYENLPRVAFEAMSSGSVLVVDDRGGWREVVEHGQTGYLCRDQREFVYYASRAAFEHEERRQMAAAARDLLETQWGLEQAKAGWSELFCQLD